MKNKLKIISIFLATLFLTGCTMVRIDTSNIDTIVNIVLSKDNQLYNEIGKGYKYYRPRGVSAIDTNELNDVLYSNGNYYYLYIDAVSYYYQSEIEYKEKDDIYYSRKIDGDKKGYIQITEENNLYHIEFVYNYAKIEAMVSKNDINKVVLDASYILSTVKFNDNIIALMLNDDYFTNKEEQYDKFKIKEENNYFLQYNDEDEQK